VTISISNLTINNNASFGTVVGVLTAQDASGTVIPCNFRLTKGSAGHFAISGNNLISVWDGSTVAGNYTVRVHANGINTWFGGNTTFTILVKTAVPPPAIPTSIVLGTPSPNIPDTAALGSLVTTVQVVMSDGSGFAGSLGFGTPFGNPGSLYNFSGSASGPTQLVLSRNLGSSDDGLKQATVIAVQNGVTVSANINVTVFATKPPPVPQITVIPANPAIGDVATVGTEVAIYTVAMSDGSPFTGTVTLTVNP
jgi:hypothetical protein